MPGVQHCLGTERRPYLLPESKLPPAGERTHRVFHRQGWDGHRELWPGDCCSPHRPGFGHRCGRPLSSRLPESLGRAEWLWGEKDPSHRRRYPEKSEEALPQGIGGPRDSRAGEEGCRHPCQCGAGQHGEAAERGQGAGYPAPCLHQADRGEECPALY
ncbi:hypothetical protein SDC9_153810 [bioreactor metagenome]|uniref:Uncharacterized protein n=1 Tax=bioreactor metagenome TaxID=1076179 RepID=A0A645F1Q8_9ZZZZ